MFGEVAVNGCLEVDDAEESATPEPALSEGSEEALDGVQPRRTGWGEVERDARVASLLVNDLGVLVGRVVIEDLVHGLAGRDDFLDGVEKADELLMAMALYATADDLAIQHVEGGEPGRRAVALVVVRHGADPALFSAAFPIAFGREPGSGFSRRSTARRHGQVGRRKARRCRGPWRRRPDRWRA